MSVSFGRHAWSRGLLIAGLPLLAACLPEPALQRPLAAGAPEPVVAAASAAEVPPPLDPQVELPQRAGVVTVASTELAPLPESLRRMRYGRDAKGRVVRVDQVAKGRPSNAPVPVLPAAKAATVPPAARPEPVIAEISASSGHAEAPRAAVSSPVVSPVVAPPLMVAAVERPPVATVEVAPAKTLPASLQQWGGTRTAPLYADPNTETWAAEATEKRLKNAAVSCSYKDEGGVRGRVMLLVDEYRLTKFLARIEMPNGGVCQFDSKQMRQKNFEQGLSLVDKDGECVVRMWEQGRKITVAAYNCHRQCSKGSFSYLWPIIMDTRVGNCY